MKRLIKQSIMNIEMFKGSLNQLSDEGRDILKLIEDYKFKLDQTCRLTANDQQLTQKLQQKRKQLDVASGQIYSIVFDIDNIDITKAYEQQQLNTNPNMPSKTTTAPVGGQPSMPQQQAPQQNGPQNAKSTDENDNSTPMPSGGGGGGSTPPSSDDGKEENNETSENSENNEALESTDESPEPIEEGNEE